MILTFNLLIISWICEIIDIKYFALILIEIRMYSLIENQLFQSLIMSILIDFDFIRKASINLIFIFHLILGKWLIAGYRVKKSFFVYIINWLLFIKLCLITWQFRLYLLLNMKSIIINVSVLVRLILNKCIFEIILFTNEHVI